MIFFQEKCFNTRHLSSVIYSPARENLHLDRGQLKGSVKEPKKFHIYETEKITRKASDAADYIELFGSSTRERHARRI